MYLMKKVITLKQLFYKIIHLSEIFLISINIQDNGISDNRIK